MLVCRQRCKDELGSRGISDNEADCPFACRCISFKAATSDAITLSGRRERRPTRHTAGLVGVDLDELLA